MASSHHAEWLSLLDISGPFLSPPVLDDVFPQGLDALDPDHATKLRLAHDEWLEEQEKSDPDPAVHDAWIRLVLTESLELSPEVLMEGESVPSEIKLEIPEYDTEVRPDFVVMDPARDSGDRQARLLISVLSPGTPLDQALPGSRWSASPMERMIDLCRADGVECRLGLVTNGEQWMLVDAPVGETSAFVSWYAELWSSEPLTLRAFRSLLGIRRFFGVAESERLVSMLEESTVYQAEVTDQLGYQVRRAVEVLVKTLDRADQDTGGLLLRDIAPRTIYEAALTVMMRLVFLFSAEERGLLRLGDPLYDQFYAVSTLAGQLREAADQVGEEVLERREDAWNRLLGTFRAIYGGVHHDSLQIIPYGSSLFDPDRFPFLEGRGAETSWIDTESTPLPIDNRTVLLLLESLQLLDFGAGRGARKLSFRALDIEQIGHVYETLLDHTARRATEPMVSLQGNQGLEPEVRVSKLHELVLQDGDGALVEFLQNALKKGTSPLRKALDGSPEPEVVARLRSASRGDDSLLGKLLPFHDLIRRDPWGDPVVIRDGAIFVTEGEDRRSTGTFYTPRALTEEIVRYALEPLVYRGAAEGEKRSQWELKTPRELLNLKVCDLATGSGAFLVQACRYLADRLVEAWGDEGQLVSDGRAIANLSQIPESAEEAVAIARRLVADRCLYGVDVNPLAVEMAKLSIWLVTLARDKPFTFLDHALKCGDSLVGVHDMSQIRHFHLETEYGKRLHDGTLFDPSRDIKGALDRATELRDKIDEFTVEDLYDAIRKEALNAKASEAVHDLRLVGDLIVAGVVSTAGSDKGAQDDRMVSLAAEVSGWLLDRDSNERSRLERRAHDLLNERKPPGKPDRRTFHWPLEFPEVFTGQNPGFDAIVSNPPFLGNKYWKEQIGPEMQHIAGVILGSTPGKVDLAVLFHRRAHDLLGSEGCFGMLGSVQSAEGQAIKVGLGKLLESSVLMRAKKGMQWPGEAKVRVNLIWLRRGHFDGPRVLDGIQVEEIGPALTPSLGAQPVPLEEPDFWAFEGVHNGRGQAFILDPDDDWFAALQDSPMLRPYISGEDLGQRPPGQVARWVIDTGDRSLHQVREEHEPTYRFLREVVEPTRTADALKSYKGLAERWWQFWNTRGELFSRLRDNERCVVMPKVAMYILPTRAPTDWCYTNKVIIIGEERADTLGVARSSVFVDWMTHQSTSFGVGSGISPSITKGVNTFVAPPFSEEVVRLGDEWNQVSVDWCRTEGEGLTGLMNAIHDEDVETRNLEDALVELDRGVARAYGWTDLDLRHDRHQIGGSMRFGPHPEARIEVLRRLAELNRSRIAAPS